MISPRAGMLAAMIAALVLGYLGLSGPALAADAVRGGVLYETRCKACHGSSVRSKGARKAKSFDGVRTQVLRWSKEAGGRWSEDEIDDVTLYLNRRFYRFPCPQSVCPKQAALAR
jgi:mono/diheme cytochrome c family protein